MYNYLCNVLLYGARKAGNTLTVCQEKSFKLFLSKVRQIYLA
jgi:hypothetical protein